MEKKKIFTVAVWNDVKLKKGYTENQMLEEFEKGFKEVCAKCKKETDNFSKFNSKLCLECFHNSDSKFKYLDYLKEKEKLNRTTQFPTKKIT